MTRARMAVMIPTMAMGGQTAATAVILGVMVIAAVIPVAMMPRREATRAARLARLYSAALLSSLLCSLSKLPRELDGTSDVMLGMR